jgi:acetoin:2,6-dichlorophenolindophenol oxidoreductase subunit beta
VTAPHTPVPFSPALEDLYIPTADAIAKAASKITSQAIAA